MGKKEYQNMKLTFFFFHLKQKTKTKTKTKTKQIKDTFAYRPHSGEAGDIEVQQINQ